MDKTRWCIKCKSELAGSEMSLSFLGLGNSGGTYCKNSKCERYGLVTLIYLEEEKKAPSDVKSNDPTGEDK